MNASLQPAASQVSENLLHKQMTAARMFSNHEERVITTFKNANKLFSRPKRALRFKVVCFFGGGGGLGNYNYIL